MWWIPLSPQNLHACGECGHVLLIYLCVEDVSLEEWDVGRRWHKWMMSRSIYLTKHEHSTGWAVAQRWEWWTQLSEVLQIKSVNHKQNFLHKGFMFIPTAANDCNSHLKKTKIIDSTVWIAYNNNNYPTYLFLCEILSINDSLDR